MTTGAFSLHTGPLLTALVGTDILQHNAEYGEGRRVTHIPFIINLGLGLVDTGLLYNRTGALGGIQ